MAIQIELSEDAEKRLTEKAKSRGIEASEYARSIVEQALTGSSYNDPGPFTPESAARFIRAMSAGGENLPILPDEAFTRESFYSDHD